MKVLFLDIDGVVNCEDTFRKGGNSFTVIDQYMAFLVGRIEMTTNCKVVLSSSWRHHKEGMKEIEKQVVKLYDVTPTLNYPNTRGDEIKAWLDAHPEVTEYAILDDDDDMLEEQKKNFFKTNWVEGLTTELAEEVIKFLNRKNKRRGI